MKRLLRHFVAITVWLTAGAAASLRDRYLRAAPLAAPSPTCSSAARLRETEYLWRQPGTRTLDQRTADAIKLAIVKPGDASAIEALEEVMWDLDRDWMKKNRPREDLQAFFVDRQCPDCGWTEFDTYEDSGHDVCIHCRGCGARFGLQMAPFNLIERLDR